MASDIKEVKIIEMGLCMWIFPLTQPSYIILFLQSFSEFHPLSVIAFSQHYLCKQPSHFMMSANRVLINSAPIPNIINNILITLY